MMNKILSTIALATILCSVNNSALASNLSLDTQLTNLSQYYKQNSPSQQMKFEPLEDEFLVNLTPDLNTGKQLSKPELRPSDTLDTFLEQFNLIMRQYPQKPFIYEEQKRNTYKKSYYGRFFQKKEIPLYSQNRRLAMNCIGRHESPYQRRHGHQK